MFSREAHSSYANSRDYAHGYLIRGTSYRTIMAYPSSGYPTRLNAFSNTLNKWSVRLGDENNDNRRKLIESREGKQ